MVHIFVLIVFQSLQLSNLESFVAVALGWGSIYFIAFLSKLVLHCCRQAVIMMACMFFFCTTAVFSVRSLEHLRTVYK